MRFPWMICLAAGLTFAVARAGSAAELVVYSAAAVRSSVVNVPADFEKATGHKVKFIFGTAGFVHDKVAAGEPADLAIIPPGPLDDLVKKGFVAGGDRSDLGTVKLSAAVASGAAKPAIATEVEFRQALLAAPQLGFADPASGATTGIYLAQLMQKMGLADQLTAKTKLYPDGQAAMEALARHEVALAVGQTSEIIPVKGVDVAGAIPDDLQLRTTYSAGLVAKSAAPEAARALLKELMSASVGQAFAANGFIR